MSEMAKKVTEYESERICPVVGEVEDTVENVGLQQILENIES